MSLLGEKILKKNNDHRFSFINIYQLSVRYLAIASQTYYRLSFETIPELQFDVGNNNVSMPYISNV